MSWFSKLTHNISQGVKNTEKTVARDAKIVEKVVEAGIKDAINVLKNAGEDIAFAPLLLFKPAMKKELDSRGISHDNTILDITGKFLKHLHETRPQNFTGSFGFARRFNLDQDDGFGMLVAPSYISPPVDIATSAVGVPNKVPGLPPLADVLWHFFKKESQNVGSATHKAVTDAAAAAGLATKDEAKGIAKVGAFLKKPQVIIAIIGTAIVLYIVFSPSKK